MEPPESFCDYCALMWQGWGGRGCCEECEIYAPAELKECTCRTVQAKGTS